MTFHPVFIKSDNLLNPIITCAAASHKVLIKMRWLHFRGAVVLVHLSKKLKREIVSVKISTVLSVMVNV